MIEVRRGVDRFRTATPGVQSWHSFSFGAHYDPDNLGFTALLAHNEDRLDPGGGYDRHAHRGLDIVTWVIDGTLEHEHWDDQVGGLAARRERLTAGCVQVLRTGRGVEHAEHAAREGSANATAGAHYVQMWLRSGRPDVQPDYARHDATADLAEAEGEGPVRPVTVASGRSSSGDAGRALALSAPGAELAVARLPAGAWMDLPAAGPAHLFVTRGALRVNTDPDREDVTLAAGDALRQRGRSRLTLTALDTSEILLWRFAD